MSFLNFNKKLYHFLTQPFDYYRIYYINSIIFKIEKTFEKDHLISLKYVKGSESTSIKIQFYHNFYIIKYSERSFYFKDRNQELMESNIDVSKLDIGILETLIRTNNQMKDFIAKFKTDFYNNEDFYKMFIIKNHDYKRANLIDTFYMKKYKDTLIKLCNNKCFFCDSNKKLQLDHFFIPKSKGGNFILKTYEGYYINNGIMLCDFCNQSKNDRSFKNFEGQIDYKKLNKIQFKMNAILNHFSSLKP